MKNETSQDGRTSSGADRQHESEKAKSNEMPDMMQAAPTGTTSTFTVKWVKPQIAITGPYQRWHHN